LNWALRLAQAPSRGEKGLVKSALGKDVPVPDDEEDASAQSGRRSGGAWTGDGGPCIYIGGWRERRCLIETV